MNTPNLFSQVKSAGFTLIELLVSIGILGILAAMSLASFKIYRDSALRIEVASIGRAIETGTEAMHSAYGPRAAGLFVLSARSDASQNYSGGSYRTKITDSSVAIPTSELQKFLPASLFNGLRRELIYTLYYGETSDVTVSTVGGHRKVNNWAVCNCKLSKLPICMVNYLYIDASGRHSGNGSRRVWVNDPTYYSSGFSISCPAAYTPPS